MSDLLFVIVVAIGMTLALTAGYAVRFIARKTWTHTSMVRAALIIALGWTIVAILVFAGMALAVYP